MVSKHGILLVFAGFSLVFGAFLLVFGGFSVVFGRFLIQIPFRGETNHPTAEPSISRA